MTVTIHLDHNIHTIANSRFISGHHSASDTFVLAMPDYKDTLIVAMGFDKITGTVRATIIDHVDFSDFRPIAPSTLRI